MNITKKDWSIKEILTTKEFRRRKKLLNIDKYGDTKNLFCKKNNNTFIYT